MITTILFLSLFFLFAGMAFTVKTPNPNFTGMRNGVQFTKGKGEATKEQAQNLVDVWGYNCAALEGTPEEKAPEKVLRTFGDEELEMADHDGVQAPIATSTNDGLKAFMHANEIAYESDDNKADLNEKINGWLTTQSSEKKDS